MVSISGIKLRNNHYYAIAKNVGVVLKMQSNWDSILKEANSGLPKDVITAAVELPMVMGHDRGFFSAAGLDYGNGIPVQGCFTVAIADYLMRNRNELKSL